MTSLSMPTLRQALADDWDAVRGLLLASDLPVDDLGPERLDGFLIAEDDNAIVGLIGLEVSGTVGLLRSLTIDAERFFQRHNFEIVERDAAPEEIRSSEEFSSLCPGTAYLMRKALE